MSANINRDFFYARSLCVISGRMLHTCFDTLHLLFCPAKSVALIFAVFQWPRKIILLRFFFFLNEFWKVSMPVQTYISQFVLLTVLFDEYDS